MAAMNNSKAMKKLGINADNLLEEFRTKLIASDDLKDCKMSLGDYFAFWQALQNPKSSSNLIASLIEALINKEKQAEKAKGKGKVFEDCRLAAQNIVHSLHFVALFVNLTSGKNIGLAITKWEKHREDHKDNLNVNADNVIKTLKKIALTHDDDLIKRFIHDLVTEGKSLRTTAAIAGEAGDKADSFITKVDFSADFPFTYLYLKALVRTNDDSRSIFDTIIENLELLPGLYKTNPEGTQNSLLCLLYIFREFLEVYPIADQSYLEHAVSVVKCFYTWPKPYGTAAAELLGVLHAEIKAPGATIRAHIMEENPLLSKEGEELSVFTERDDIMFKCLTLYAGIQRAAFVHYDDSRPESNVYRELFGNDVEEEKWKQELHEARVGLLYSALESDLAVHPDGPDSEILRFDDRDPTSVMKWFAHAREVFLQADLIDNTLVKGYRESFLSELVKSIVPGDIPRPVRYVNPDEEVSFVVDATVDASKIPPPPVEDLIVKDAFQRQHFPKLPELTMDFREIKKEIFDTAESFPDTIGPKKHIDFPELTKLFTRTAKVTVEVVPIAENCFKDKAGGGEREILMTRPVLKLCCLGDNSTLHRLLCCFVNLHHQLPEDCDKLDLRMYIVAVGGNVAADYIAVHDSWYRRHVHSPFTDLSLLPHVSFDDTVRMDSFFCESSPIAQMRRLMLEYFRGARKKMEVCVYDCECWVFVKPTNQIANVTIPFCVSAEIGINADIRSFQSGRTARGAAAGGVRSGLPLAWDEVLLDKTFNRLPNVGMSAEVTLKYTTVDMRGNVMKTVDVPAASYGHIGVVNIPSLAQRGRSTADPTQPWLELNTLLNKGKYIDVMSKKDKKPKDVEAVFKQLNTEGSYTDIGYIEIAVADPGNTFDVMLDGGIPFGGFQRIRITPTRIGSHKHLKLPLMSFFPIVP